MKNSSQLESFMECIQYISRMMKRNVRNQTLPYGITKSQWFILRNLARKPCAIGELAKRLEVRSSSMSQMIDRLELAGLVERQADERDARTKVVKLSELGKERMEEITQSGIQLLADPFSKLSSEEKETLIILLQKFTGHLSTSIDHSLDKGVTKKTD